MEETKHVNLKLEKTNTHYVGTTTTRLWPELLRFTRSMLRGVGSHGTYLTAIINSAIIVEGFVTDIILDQLDGKKPNSSKAFDPERATWKDKLKAFEELFGKRIEDFNEFEGLEVLFLLRNNISHGRSHVEISKIDIQTGEKSIVESKNRNYQKVRDYLVKYGILTPKDTPSNVDVLWKPLTAALLLTTTESFLHSVLKMENIRNKEGLSSELQTALQV